jgi:hypothetical protein
MSTATNSIVQPKKKFLHQGGLHTLAESLHAKFGTEITCHICNETTEYSAYSRDSGGNAGDPQFARRQYRCRNKSAHPGEGGAAKSCKAYIERAVQTLGWDTVEAYRLRVYEVLRKANAPSDNVKKPWPRPRATQLVDGSAPLPKYDRSEIVTTADTTEPEELVVDLSDLPTGRAVAHVPALLTERDINTPTEGVVKDRKRRGGAVELCTPNGKRRQVLEAVELTPAKVFRRDDSPVVAGKRSSTHHQGSRVVNSPVQATKEAVVKPSATAVGAGTVWNPDRLHKAIVRVEELHSALLEAWEFHCGRVEPLEIPDSTGPTPSPPCAAQAPLRKAQLDVPRQIELIGLSERRRSNSIESDVIVVAQKRTQPTVLTGSRRQGGGSVVSSPHGSPTRLFRKFARPGHGAR